MRTTVRLEEDVAAAVEQLRRERGLGLSEAINELARAGLRVRPQSKPFKQRTRSLGLRIDVNDVSDAIETLEGPGAK